MNLVQYSLDNTKIVYFFLAVLLIGGILSFGRLGKKEDAPFVIKSAVIMTRYPGAEPAEVERLVTEPISREIQSMSGVYKIKSESMYGLSKITFELQPSLSAASIPQKWDELRRKVLNIQPQLPAGSSVPTVSDDFGDVFGIYYGLVGDDGGRRCDEGSPFRYTDRGHPYIHLRKQAGRNGYRPQAAGQPATIAEPDYQYG